VCGGGGGKRDWVGDPSTQARGLRKPLLCDAAPRPQAAAERAESLQHRGSRAPPPQRRPSPCSVRPPLEGLRATSAAATRSAAAGSARRRRRLQRLLDAQEGRTAALEARLAAAEAAGREGTGEAAGARRLGWDR